MAIVLLGRIFAVIVFLVVIICIVKERRKANDEENRKDKTRNIELETISTITSEKLF